MTNISLLKLAQEKKETPEAKRYIALVFTLTFLYVENVHQRYQ